MAPLLWKAEDQDQTDGDVVSLANMLYQHPINFDDDHHHDHDDDERICIKKKIHDEFPND